MKHEKIFNCNSGGSHGAVPAFRLCRIQAHGNHLPDKVEGTMEELLNEIVAQQPVEFDGGVETIDLTDTSEEGQWAIKSSTGLDNAGVLTEAAVFEPMIGSIAFSMVMVRVAPGEDINPSPKP